MPPGLVLFVMAMAAGAITLLLQLAFLLAGLFVQEDLPFSKRRPFRLFLGALLPLSLSLLGTLFANFASDEWKDAGDRAHPGWYIGIYLVSWVSGILLSKKKAPVARGPKACERA